MSDEFLEQLQERLGYRFVDPQLLLRALTHRSFANEQELPENYERLEFLGDSVLGLLTVEALFQYFPRKPEGELSRMKSHLVSEPVLARHARAIGLGEALALGVGEERSGGREKASLLADALEALIGACYTECGLSGARRIVGRMLSSELERVAEGDYGDPKTRLQELAQSRGWPLPVYRLIGADGPDHEKVFVVECEVDGEPRGSGRGRTKKRAERRAALEALDQLKG